MKQNLIQLVNSAGTPQICYQADSVENVAHLYPGLLLRISQRGLYDYAKNPQDQAQRQNLDKMRFVTAKNQHQKQLLMRVQPIRCYLRDHEMSSRVIQLNPYQSVRWLKKQVQKQRNHPVKLIINQTQLTQDSDSLIHYIFQNAIIHVIECRPRQQQFISVLYTKQPGSQSRVYKIENVHRQGTVEELMRLVAGATGVPLEFLMLVYGGKILNKERRIGEYHILDNSFVYAVDTRKYMRKVTRDQYNKKLQQVRKFRQSNQYIAQRVRQQVERKRTQSAQKRQRQRVIKGTYERSGDVMRNLDDDVQFFKNPSMEIQMDQMKEFQKIGERLEHRDSQNNGYTDTGLIMSKGEGLYTPPNSPIYLFNTPNPLNNELKQGRLITTETQTYQDPLGYTHQHTKSKTLYKTGQTNIVQLDIAEDPQGNIVKVQKDTINIKKDSLTGNTIKTEVDVIEDGDTGKTVVNRVQVRDSEGRVVKQETEVYKIGEGVRRDRDVIVQGEHRTVINTEILSDQTGEPYKIQTDVCQTNQDAQGNTYQRTKDIKQQDGITKVTQKNIIRDKQGNILSTQTDTIQITESPQGNIYKHEQTLTQTAQKKVLIERDVVTDSHGEILTRETNMKVFKQDQNENLQVHETDLIEKGGGSALVVERTTVCNAEGEVVRMESQVFEVGEGGDRGEVGGGKRCEMREEVDQLGNVYKYEKTQIISDQTHKVIYQTDTITNPSGHPILKQTNTTTIEQSQNHTTTIHQTETIQQLNNRQNDSQTLQNSANVKKIHIQRQIVTDPTGAVLSKQVITRVIEKDSIGDTVIHETNVMEGVDGEIVRTENNLVINQEGIVVFSAGTDEDGSRFEHERVEVQEEGVTKVVETDTILNALGNIVSRQTNTRTFQQDQNKNKILIQTQLIQKQPQQGHTQGLSQNIQTKKQLILDPQGTIIKSTQIDEQGNLYTYNRKQQDKDNKLTVTETAIITNKQGQVIGKEINTTVVEEDQKRNLFVKEVDVVEREVVEDGEGRSDVSQASNERSFGGRKIVVQKETVTDSQGNIIAKETNTIVTHQDQNKNIITHETDIIQQTKFTKKSQNQPYSQQLDSDQPQKVSKTCIIQKQTITSPQGQIITTQTKIKVIEHDQQNNTIVYESNVVDQKDADRVLTVQNNTVINQMGIVVKQQGKDQQGNVYQYERTEDRGDGRRTVVEVDVVRNREGEVLSQQTHTKVFQSDPYNNIIIRDINETTQGAQTKILQTDTILDAYGNLIGTDTTQRVLQQRQAQQGQITYIREKQITEPNYGKSSQTERYVQVDQQGVILRSLSTHADGNVHLYQRKQQDQGENKRVTTAVDTLRDPQGNLLYMEESTRVLESDQNKNTIMKETSVIVERDGNQPSDSDQFVKKIIVQKQVVQDSQGRVLAKETNQKVIQVDDENNKYIRQKDIVQQIKYQTPGQNPDALAVQTQPITKTSIIQTQTLTNAQGQILVGQKHIQVIQKDSQNNTVIFQTNQITQKDSDQIYKAENETVLDQSGNVVRSSAVDEEGNSYRYVKEERQEEDGKRVIFETDMVSDREGQILSKETNTTVIEKDQNKNTTIHVTEVIQQMNADADQSEEKTSSKIIIQKQIICDPQGNILAKQTNTRKIQKDSNQNTVVYQTTLLQQHESFNPRSSIIEKQIITSPQGEVLINETKIRVVQSDTNQNTVVFENTTLDEKDAQAKREVQRNTIINQEGIVIRSEDRDQDGIVHEFERSEIGGPKRKIIMEKDVLRDADGEVLVKETNTRVIKQNTQQYTTVRQTDIIQQDGKITALQSIVELNPQGQVLKSYERDEDGNIRQYTMDENIIQAEDGEGRKKVIVEKEVVTNQQGEVVLEEVTTKVIQKDSMDNLYIHETNLIGENGAVTQVQNKLIITPQGQVLQSQRKVNQLDLQKGPKPPAQIQLYHQQPQAIYIDDQRQPLINAGKQITVDELGNTHTHQKQLIEKQGKTTFVDRDTIQDPRGKVIRVQTDIVEIEGDQDGNMHKHKSEIVEQDGKVSMVETDQIVDPDGVVLRKEKDTIEIEGGQDGSVIKHEKDVIEQQGKTRIIQKQIIQDSEGNVLRSTTKVTQVQDNEDATQIHRRQETIQAVQVGEDEQGQDNQQEISRDVEIVQDQSGHVLTRQKQVKQNQIGQQLIVQKCTFQTPQGQTLRQQTQTILINPTTESYPEIHRHLLDYQQSQDGNRVLIQQSTAQENPDGSLIREERQRVQLEMGQDGNVRRREVNVVEHEDGSRVVYVRNTVEDQEGRVLSKSSDVVEIEGSGQRYAISSGLQPATQQPQITQTTQIDDQGYTHTLQTETQTTNNRQIQIERSYLSDPDGNLLKTETGLLDVQLLQDGNTKFTAVDIIQGEGVVTVVENSFVQDEEGRDVRTEEGVMKVRELGAGVRKTVKESVIEEGGIRLRVEKEIYEDQEGNIIQQQINTTQLHTSQQTQQQSLQPQSQPFTRKQQKVHQDEHGNTHFYQRQIVDTQQGKTTVVETEVVRNDENELLTATTDVIEMTRQEDGNVIRHEINIVEKPGKVTMAETNALENAEGERIVGEVQSIVVTTAENGQIHRKTTGIIVQNQQKTIIERTTIQSPEGTILHTQTHKKRIYIDQNGQQRARDMQTYQADQIEIQGEPSTIEKEVFVDVEGVVHATERLTTVKAGDGDGTGEVMETTTVKVVELADGSFGGQEMSVTKVIRKEDGEIEVITTPIQIPAEIPVQQPQYTQISSQIHNTSQIQREIIEDQHGNLHTFQKQIIQPQQQGEPRTVIQSEIVENQSGKVIQINTNVQTREERQDGTVLTHVTEIESGDRVISRQTFTVQGGDGSVISENSRRVVVEEDQGLIKTKTVDVVYKDGRTTVNQYVSLEDQEGNLLDSSTNRLEIDNNQEAVKKQAQIVAKAQVQGQITGHITKYSKNEQGNLQVTQRETIQDNGRQITVDSTKIQTLTGQVIQAETDITSKQVLEDGRVCTETALIREEGDSVCVVRSRQVGEDETNLERLVQEREEIQERSQMVRMGQQEHPFGDQPQPETLPEPLPQPEPCYQSSESYHIGYQINPNIINTQKVTYSQHQLERSQKSQGQFSSQQKIASGRGSMSGSGLGSGLALNRGEDSQGLTMQHNLQFVQHGSELNESGSQGNRQEENIYYKQLHSSVEVQGSRGESRLSDLLGNSEPQQKFYIGFQITKPQNMLPKRTQSGRQIPVKEELQIKTYPIGQHHHKSEAAQGLIYQSYQLGRAHVEGQDRQSIQPADDNNLNYGYSSEQVERIPEGTYIHAQPIHATGDFDYPPRDLKAQNSQDNNDNYGYSSEQVEKIPEGTYIHAQPIHATGDFDYPPRDLKAQNSQDQINKYAYSSEQVEKIPEGTYLHAQPIHATGDFDYPRQQGQEGQEGQERQDLNASNQQQRQSYKLGNLLGLEQAGMYIRGTGRVQYNLLDDSYGPKEPGQIRQEGSQIKQQQKESNQKVTYNLLQQNQQQLRVKSSQLPLYSKFSKRTVEQPGIQPQPLTQPTPTPQPTPQPQLLPQLPPQIPQQYDIILINRSDQSRTRIRVRFDDIMDQVAEKLSFEVGVEKASVRFYRTDGKEGDGDGEEFPEYEMVSDLVIMPEAEIYYSCSRSQQ